MKNIKTSCRSGILSLFCIILSVLMLFPLFASCEAEDTDIRDIEEEESMTKGEMRYADPEDDIPFSLPVVNIYTDSGRKVSRDREYEGASVSLSGTASGKYDFEGSRCEIKSRGNSTLHMDKQSYRIKFEEKVNMNGQGKGPSKSWVLLANFNDPTMLRNHITLNAAKELDNLSFVSSSSFVRVFLNGKFQGVYELAEHHGEGKYRIVMDDDPDETDTDYLIEQDDYQIDRPENIPYTIEYDGNGYVIKNDIMTNRKWKFVYEFIRETDSAVKSKDRETIEKYIDPYSFADMYLVQEISKNPDGGISSLYYLKKGGGVLYATCPWDFDIAYGNDSSLDKGSAEGLFIGNPIYGFDYERRGLPKGSTWMSALMSQEWFADLVLERWNEKKDVLLSSMMNTIDEAEEVFFPELLSNFEVWDLKNEASQAKAGEHPDYLNNLEALRTWIKERFEWLDGYLNIDKTRYRFVNTNLF